MRYDPTNAPDPASWLGTAESDRLQAVLQHHKNAGEKAKNLQMHAAIHVTVETQLAEGFPPTIRTMDRLLGEGLSRHEALHAIGSAVAEQIHAAMARRTFDPNEYEARLDGMTAQGWRSGSTSS